MYEIGIDMGGTHTAVGLVKGLMLLDAVEFSTHTEQGAENYIEELARNVEKLLQQQGIPHQEISSVGVGVPGSANQESGMIEYANNLGFFNVPFQEMLSRRLQKLTVVDNDANLAAYGEFLLCQSSAKSFLMVTLGTGIGGGMIFDGKIYRGVNFAEGEIGHMTIRYDGIPCNCGRNGCFEAYASASALLCQAKRAAAEHPQSLLWQLCGGCLEQMNGRIFFQAVKEQDAIAVMVRDKYTTFLAEGLTNLINIFQPEELVIGGGISQAEEWFLPQTREKIKKLVYSRESARNTILRPAKFGNDAGIIGAARLVDFI